MSDDAPPAKKRRHQTNTERDLEGLEARALRERERQEMDQSPADLAVLELPGPSDGTPEDEAEFDALTPPPFDLTEDPRFAALWTHTDKNYRRSVNKLLRVLGGGNLAATVARHGKELARIRVMTRVAQIIGAVLIAVCSLVGGVALKAIYGSGVDRGSVTETLRIHERDIEYNRDANQRLREALDKIDRDWRNTLLDHERNHSSRRARFPSTSPADGPPADPTPGDPP